MTVADGNNKSCESEGGDLLKTIKVYRPSMVSSLKAIADLPESSATTQEVAAAYSSQSSKREQLENAPMLTKRLRTERDAKEHEQKRQKFPQARLRIKFADQTMVETTMSSDSGLDDVYTFVTTLLLDKEASFLLYQTPPRRELHRQDTQSLLQLDLAPSALLYIKFSDPLLNDTAKPPPLRPELTGSVEELPPASQLSAKQPDPNTNTPEDKVTKRSAKDLSKDGKMPKWLNKAIGKK